MKFSLATAVTAFAVGTAAQGYNATVTTQVVTAYTTFCPSPTTFAHGGTTYTVTEATTLTLTASDCACKKTSTVAVTSVAPVPVTTATAVTPVSPVTPGTTVIPVTTSTTVKPVTPVSPTTYSVPPYANGTTVGTSGVATGTGKPTVTPYAGGAGRTVASAGAAFAGVAAIAMMAF